MVCPVEFDLGVCLLALSVGLSLIHYYHLFKLTVNEMPEGHAEADVPVSVIIAARNESRNLAENLPSILSQDYPRFEVVVADDHSHDDTAEVLNKLQTHYVNLIYTSLDGEGGKKRAVTAALDLAQYDWLLFTDADCTPRSDHWIRSMLAHRKDETEVVLGYSPFRKTGFMVNTLVRVDTFTAGVQYLAFAGMGSPYMGVGRNMAYKKNLFHSAGGFKRHMGVLSGDDDLFIQYAATGCNTVIALDVDSQTISEAKSSFREWFSQKRRHTSAGFHYRFSTLMVLGLIQFNIAAFYALAVSGFWNNDHVLTVLFLVLFRFYSQYAVLKKAARRLGEVDLLLLSLILELPVLIFNLSAALSNIFFRNKRWS